MSIRVFHNHMNGAVLAKIFCFPLHVSHTSEIRSSKLNFQSSLTPSNLSHLLFSISCSPT